MNSNQCIFSSINEINSIDQIKQTIKTIFPDTEKNYLSEKYQKTILLLNRNGKTKNPKSNGIEKTI